MTVIPTPSPVVELRGVSKQFGARLALRDVSLRVDPGEVVVILGPNGAGKTTAISTMLGIRQPTIGKARMFGMNPRDLRARHCHITVSRDGDCATLMVTDDGAVASGTPHTGTGLANLCERAEQLGGTVSFGAGPDGGGHRLCLQVPLPVTEPDA